MLKKTIIDSTNIPDLWFQALYNILEVGREFEINSGSFAGSKRLEYDYFIGHIKYPGKGDLIPTMPEGSNLIPPVSDDYLVQYLPYLMTNVKHKNESYTYGQRLTEVLISETIKMNQIEHIINTYKYSGHRNNQMVLQIAQPSDLELEDPPCLRHIDTRIQDNKLHFFVYFRSWDLWGGLPANLAAIQILKKYMADAIEVDDGEMIVESKGLHLYDYAVDFAKIRCMR